MFDYVCLYLSLIIYIFIYFQIQNNRKQYVIVMHLVAKTGKNERWYYTVIYCII